MLLTSLERVKNGLNITDGSQDNLISKFISLASRRIERYLRREDSLQLKTYVQYFDPYFDQRQYHLNAYPVQSITLFETDPMADYTGGQQVIPASSYKVVDIYGKPRCLQLIALPIYPIGVVIYANTTFTPLSPAQYSVLSARPRSVRITYVGGLAADPVASVWTSTSTTAMTAGKFIQGAISGACGVIQTTGSGGITYRSIYGLFQAGETIAEFSTLSNAASGGGLSGATGHTATLTTCTSQALAESNPDLVEACEFEVSFLKDNRKTFNNPNVSIDQITKVARSDMRIDYDLTPEVRSFLEPYRNKLMVNH